MRETGTIAAASAPGPGHEVGAAAPGAMAVSVVVAPQHSVLALLRQAASGQAHGAPAGLLTGIRDALRPQARFAAQGFTARGWATIPECCVPISPLADASVAEQAARLRDIPAAALTSELEAFHGDHHCPPEWRAAAEQPRRWLHSMADASLDTWAVAEPRWRAAGPLLDREIRRIGTAAVRGGIAALLNSLHPGLRYRDGTFTFTSTCDPSFNLGSFDPVGPRRLALVPMIAGDGMLLLSFERADVCWIGYPLPRPRPRPGAQATVDSALATILGPVRAAILQALRQPLTVSGLAAAVHCAPTTATYHLHQLAGAGLITREASGTRVWVSRTARGDELVDLLSA
jgi:DNA-binding transcriptional ArsR family regulator